MRRLFIVPSLVAACAGEPLESDTAADLLEYPADPANAPDWSSVTGVTYQGGMVMTGTPTLHVLYYGAPSASRRAIVDDFVASVSGTPLANVLTTYADAGGAMPTGSFSVTTPAPTGRFAGDHLDVPQFQQIIANAGPVDESGLYVIIGDAATGGITTSSRKEFCSGPCGWHNHVSVNGKTTQFAFIGDPAHCRAIDTTPSCQFKYPTSPNNDPDTDHMINVIWHEIAEAVSDPRGGGYQPEVGDLCEGPFVEDTTSRPAAGYVQHDLDYGTNANVHVGARDYLVQPIWQNVGGGGCVRRLALQHPAAGKYMTGDLDHSGSPDLIFRNSTTNNLSMRSVNPSGVAGPLTHIGSPTSDFQIAGIADFDNDGSADILWRNLQTGRITVWLMNGATPTPHELAAGGVIDPVWSIRAVGDFDGDGKADILFLNLATNATKVWLDNHNGPIGTFTFADLQTTSIHPSSGESIDVVGTGDFDGDGKADILWHRLDTAPGADVYRLWTMNGASASAVTIPSSGFDRVLGIVDVPGNLYAHILAVSGTDVIYADPSGFTSVVGALPASQWRFVGGSRAVFGGSYLFWQNRQTGDIHRWNVDSSGHKISSTAVVNNQNLDFEVVAY
jgi:phosphate-induced protein 1/VCBS repeat protein